MTPSWRLDDLPQLVAELERRPGHEKVRTLVTDLLRNGFGVAYAAFDHEVRMPEVGGRADMLFGATIFEFKSDLRREDGDVLAKLPQYLAERERQTNRRYLGIATDGATFVAYDLRAGVLQEIARHAVRRGEPEALLQWLEPALSDRDELAPDAATFRRELGKESLTYGSARATLGGLWATLQGHPEVRLKRDLWDGLLREAYGTPVADDGLFLQHSYLTVVAKTLAIRVLDLPLDDAAAILSGRALADAGIQGAVEGDFFDWVLLAPGGRDLVLRLARQVARFRLRDVEADVLKALYESLIDPAQRKDLGEYYTPDWLAAKLVREVLPLPLTTTVLDPACGSGTFLFHVVRSVVAAGRGAGWPDARIVKAAAAQVRGLDVHPVAVIIARVTWLLALGPAIQGRDGPLEVPVYLGDALQWNLSRLGDVEEVNVPVPGEGPLFIPAGIAQAQERFEPALRALSDGLEANARPESVGAMLARIGGIDAQDAATLTATYTRLLKLKAADRNGIWPFILRNLVRPVWLSRPDHRAELVVGNPPWVAYRFLSPEMQGRLREACLRLNLWVGGVLTTQQDLCALFFARAAERYLAPGGTVAFVLPWAALNRPAFAGLRAGLYGGQASDAQVRLTAAWSLEAVRPLFPTSACVVIARREAAGPLPAEVERFAGALARRDAGEAEADRMLTRTTVPWPPLATRAGRSPYRDRFRNGATVFPRRFFLVEPEAAGRLGASRSAPLMRGRVGKLDKAPWKDVEPPRGAVEKQFLRPLLLGEGIAPFRLLGTTLAVIPAEGAVLMDAAAAAAAGHRHLAAWLRDIEGKWEKHGTRGADGKSRMSLSGRIDHVHALSTQLTETRARVVYTASGTLISAFILAETAPVVEHKAYWLSTSDPSEADFLCAIINSETVLSAVRPMQSRGWRDPRDFDKLIWELPIPEFDPEDALHQDLAAAGAEATVLAATVPLPEGDFRRKRRAIRDALAAAGLTVRMEALVAALLAG